MAELNDIWNSGKGKLPEDKLMAYLEGRLSPEEQHEVETWLAEEGMESDALEGLKDLSSGETKQLVSKLNHTLKTQLSIKKRLRRAPLPNQWSWVAVLVILLLCILAYVVINAIN